MKSFSPSLLVSGLLLVFLLAMAAPAGAAAGGPKIVLSKDGTPISYEEYGSGEPTLVFVHGWSGDSRYWRAQIPVFAEKYRVITVDLAGHGHSGLTRGRYTMERFGEDVQAVVDASGSGPVILIGHSMGGPVIAEAARLQNMEQRVIGLIGVDTLHNIEQPMTRTELDRMLAPLAANFRLESRRFIDSFLAPDTDADLREWILADMSAAPPYVALSAFEEMMLQFVSGRAARVFDRIRAPVVCVNSDRHPVDFAANRNHMPFFAVIELKQADHFFMLTRPAACNQALQQAVYIILRQVAQMEPPARPGS